MGRTDTESKKALATAKAYQQVLEASAAAQKVLTDPNASPEAKAAARQSMDTATTLATWGYQNAMHQPVGEKRLASLQEGFSLTGVAQASMERDNVQQRAVKLSEDTLKVQEQMRDYLKTLVDKLQPAAGEQPIFSKGVGGY